MTEPPDPLTEATARLARQHRELALLRQSLEQALENFARLETHVWQTGGAERALVTTLPALGSGALRQVEQRLPGDSTGLCDLAIWIETPAQGLLTARLSLIESGQVLATWQVAPKAGWLRLALPRALPCDPQTAVLRLTWEGAPLAIGLSHPHPDPRWQGCDGQLLALRLWRFLPGAQAPYAPDCIPPLATTAPKSWRIGLSDLAQAFPALTHPQGLLVPQGADPLRLMQAAPKGLRRLFGTVTAQDAPATACLVLKGHPPGPKLSLAPQEEGQVQLFLPEPLTEAADLQVIVTGSALIGPIHGFADG